LKKQIQKTEFAFDSKIRLSNSLEIYRKFEKSNNEFFRKHFNSCNQFEISQFNEPEQLLSQQQTADLMEHQIQTFVQTMLKN